MFAIVGAFAMTQAKISMRAPSLGKVTAHIKNKTLLMIIGRDIPYLRETEEIRNEENIVSRVLFDLTTSVDPKDPRSFLGRELPLFALFDSEIDVASADVDFTSIPIESPPPPELEREIIKGVNQLDEDEEKSIAEEESPNRKRVFIYHSHFWESYLPDLKRKDPNRALHAKKNIMLVGKHMAKTLNRMRIGALTMDKAPNTYWKGAYRQSRKMIIRTMKRHKDLTYLVDMHRDSRRRKQTTIQINGESYARLAFVVGVESKHYEKNLQLARQLHKKINEKYPGLSKAVFRKARVKGNNGEYNQSLSPNSILVEVGGVDNRFEEAYRSVDVLANVLGEIILEATPVNE
jgi:stage II sporulation protein P